MYSSYQGITPVVPVIPVTDPFLANNAVLIRGTNAGALDIVVSPAGQVVKPNFYQAQSISIPIPGYKTLANLKSKPTGGYWDDPTTWLMSDGVTPANRVPILNVDTIDIQGGMLRMHPLLNTQLICRTLMVLGPDGTPNFPNRSTFEAGNDVTQVIANGVICKVLHSDLATDSVNDPNGFWNGRIIAGNITAYGFPRNRRARVAGDIKAGDTALVLAAGQSSAGWQPGDQIYLPDTRPIDNGQFDGIYQSHSEIVTVASVSANGLTINLQGPPFVRFNHPAARLNPANGGGIPNKLFDGQPMAALIYNQTFNMIFDGVNGANQTQGNRPYAHYIYKMKPDEKDIAILNHGRSQYIQDPTASHQDPATIFTRPGRWPLWFNGVIGDPNNPADVNVQGEFINCMVDMGNPITSPPNTNVLTSLPSAWGIVCSSFTNYMLIQGCLVKNFVGAGYVIDKDGYASFNTFQDCMAAEGIGSGLRDDFHGVSGSGFWISGVVNNFIGCAATNCRGVLAQFGIATYGFSFNMVEYEPSYNSKSMYLPNFQGADSGVPGTFTLVAGNNQAITTFRNCEIFGAMQSGWTNWWIGKLGDTGQYPTAPLNNINAMCNWNLSAFGVFLYPSSNTTFNNYDSVGDATLAATTTFGQFAIWGSDYPALGVNIIGGRIENWNVGINPSYFGGDYLIQKVTGCCNIFLAVNTLSCSRSLSNNAFCFNQIITADSCVNKAPSGNAGPIFILRSYLNNNGGDNGNLQNLHRIAVLSYQKADGTGPNFNVYLGQQNPAQLAPLTNAAQNLVASNLATSHPNSTADFPICGEMIPANSLSDKNDLRYKLSTDGSNTAGSDNLANAPYV